MPARRNKKVLCFIDEFGTAGAGELYLGAVMVSAAVAGRIDKQFSDLLEPSAAELHAVRLDSAYVQGLLERLRQVPGAAEVLLVNRKVTHVAGSGPEIYAHAVVELVTMAASIYKREVAPRRDLNNIDLVLDQNHHNTHPAFDAAIARAREGKGQFRGVNGMARIDSAASRLLQLADLVASVRKWVAPAGPLRAEAVRSRFGMRIV